MKKINSIKFKNFKAFYGEETLQLDGKNLLVYGENGSGKSSIFWGLYTFLQSSTKPLAEITKYFVHFDKNNARTYNSLKNIYAEEVDDSEIILNTVENDTIYLPPHIINSTTSNTIGADKTIALANASSDFINYKLLYNFYNVTHKHELNLWEVFVHDIFPYFKKEEQDDFYLKRINDILKGVPMEPNGIRRANKNSLLRLLFDEKISALNNDIILFLSDIAQNANKFLKEQFNDNIDSVKILLEYKTKIDYNSVYNKSNKFKILFNVEVFDKIKQEWRFIRSPHSFLNEAQLTRIAISIRIGALLTRLQTGIHSDYKILCLDDMLISLDMGNRDKVIQLILNVEKKASLNFFDDFQKIIFTHDKGFFNLCKQRIRLSGQESNWINKEIYLDTGKVPQRPYIDNSKDYFEKTEKHLKAFDYPAAANALRQGLENLIFEFLPNSLRLTKERKGEELTTPKQLHDLLEGVKYLHKLYAVDISKINDLFVYKDNILNPLSHDNIDTPVYKDEIQKVLDLVPDLKKLKSDVLKERDEFSTIIKFVDTKTDTGEIITYYIELSDNLLKYTLLDGSIHLSRCKVKALKYIYPDGREVVRNIIHNSLYDYSKQIAHFLQKTYVDDSDILSKIQLT